MTRQRTDQQVITRARQADTARTAGLTAEHLLELVAARTAWHSSGRLRRILLTPTLIEAAELPAAMAWDAVFTATIRRELRNLSEPRPNVLP